jgi:hypothetical protein
MQPGSRAARLQLARRNADVVGIEAPLAAAAPEPRRLRLPARLDANGLSLAAVGVFGLLVAVTLRQQLVQDSWLSLLSGREIVRHGLPHHDTLFVWTSGRGWIDQQWLAHVAYYGLYTLGGIRLVLAAHAASVVGAAAIVVTAARRRGASNQAVFLTSFVCLLIAPWALQLRAQSLAELLFAACFVLLLDDRALTVRRVAAVLLLLVLWANVHGTVVLGVLLALLRGTTALRRGQRLHGGLLAALAPCCIVASPYALELAGYYHRMLANPLMSRYVGEWQRSWPSPRTAFFYLVLGVGAWRLARVRRSVPLFDQAAFVLLGLAAVQALRGIVWFGLAAVPLLAPRLDSMISQVRPLASTAASRAGLALAAAGTIVTCAVFAHPSGWFVQEWPAQAAHDVAALAAEDPHVEVFADDQFADWLLWSEPSLRGRVAYDIRFELFTERQFRSLGRYRATKQAPRPGDPLYGYDVFVSSPRTPTCFTRCRAVYRSPSVLVARS